jgi:hypothetical protein
MFLWTGCLLRWLKASGISKANEPPCAEGRTGGLHFWYTEILERTPW